MKIKSCEIGSFGGLSDKIVVLDDGITVIRGKNESGKTTLSSFIKYVLYGFVGKGRDESVNEKLKYSPRNGTESHGALVLQAHDGSILRAERRGDGKSGSSRLIDSLGSDIFEGMEIGEALYGIDAVTFAKSAYVGQGDVETADMKGLGASLERVLLEADGDGDFDKVQSALVGERNSLYNKMRSTGLIFDLSARLDELCEKKERESGAGVKIATLRHTREETEKRIEENKAKLVTLYSEAENITAYEAHELLLKIEDAQKRLLQAEQILDSILSKSERNGMIPDGDYLTDLELAYNSYVTNETLALKTEKDYAAARRESDGLCDSLGIDESGLSVLSRGVDFVKELYGSAKSLAKGKKRYTVLAIVFLCLILTFPLSIAFFILASGEKKALCELLEANNLKSLDYLKFLAENAEKLTARIIDTNGVLLVKRKDFERAGTEFSESSERLIELLSCLGVRLENSENAAKYARERVIPEVKSIISETDKARARISADKAALEALLSFKPVETLKAEEAKMQPEPPKRKKEEVELAIKYNERANTLLEKKLSELTAQLAASEAVISDPVKTEEEILAVKAELEKARERLCAVELAIELVDDSRKGLRSGILPRVSEAAGELFSKFTGGKYRSLFFDKDFGVKILASDETETRRVRSLSAGTLDAAYIALRISLAKVLSREKPTFIFDESFVRCDDERLKTILEYLNILSKEYQIIILTCQEREEKILGDRCRVIVLDKA